MTEIIEQDTALPTQAVGAFNSIQAFEDAQRMAKCLSTSTLVPKEYKANLGDTMIAMELAQRMNANILMVMQNLHVIHGKPAWSSKFIIACINRSGRFSPLQFKIEDLGEITVNNITLQNLRCVAKAVDLSTGEYVEGAPVTMEMAIREGWYTKSGSKWPNMPETMLRYRAASFFGSVYAPDLLMGMPTVDELKDIGDLKDVTPRKTVTEIGELLEGATLEKEGEQSAEKKTKGRGRKKGYPRIREEIEAAEDIATIEAALANIEHLDPALQNELKDIGDRVAALLQQREPQQ